MSRKVSSELCLSQAIFSAIARLSGFSPFVGKTDAQTLCNVTMAKWDFNIEEFDDISKDAKAFISALLVKEPK